MTTCPSCGGVLGRDCYNPGECAEITRDMTQRGQAADHEIAALRARLSEAERERDNARFEMQALESTARGNCAHLIAERDAARAEAFRLLSAATNNRLFDEKNATIARLTAALTKIEKMDNKCFQEDPDGYGPPPGNDGDQREYGGCIAYRLCADIAREALAPAPGEGGEEEK